MRPLSPRYRLITRLVFGVIAASLILFFLLSRISTIRAGMHSVISILTPFLLGSLIAFLLKPICNRLDKILGDFFVARVFHSRIESGKTTEKRVRRFAEKISILVAAVCFFLIVIGVFLLVVPSLVRSLMTLKDDIPSYLRKLDDWMVTLNRPGNVVGQFIYSTYQSIYNNIVDSSGNFLSGLIANYQTLLSTAGRAISMVLSFFVDVLVTVVSSVYILLNRKRFAVQANMLARAAFKKNVADWVVNEFKFTNRKFSEFFSGKIIDSLLVGIILYVVFTIVRIPQAPLIAVFMAFCNIIPFFGPYVGAFPCFFIVLMADTGRPINVLYFLIIVVVVQQLDGNILDPYIVGDNVGLSSFWVLFAVMLFGGLFGFAGLLLGVPLFAVLYDMIRQLVNFGLKKRGEEQLMTNYNFIYHNPEEERGARKKRAVAIKAARKEARTKEAAERAEAEERELAVAISAAKARAEAEAAEKAAAEKAASEATKNEEDESSSSSASSKHPPRID